MNGPQDMGGFMGFGPVVPEAGEPVFHAEWERRALALVLAIGALGRWNLDIARHTRESIPATSYWSMSYYEIWLTAMLTLMQQNGLVTAEELASGRPAAVSAPHPKMLRGEAVPAVLARGGPSTRPGPQPALFHPGDRVRTLNANPKGHTRLPRYAMGHAGEITAVHGIHVFPDASAKRQGDDPQWLYNVRFAASELWGGNRAGYVHLDLWEPYLEPL